MFQIYKDLDELESSDSESNNEGFPTKATTEVAAIIENNTSDGPESKISSRPKPRQKNTNSNETKNKNNREKTDQSQDKKYLEHMNSVLNDVNESGEYKTNVDNASRTIKKASQKSPLLTDKANEKHFKTMGNSKNASKSSLNNITNMEKKITETSKKLNISREDINNLEEIVRVSDNCSDSEKSVTNSENDDSERNTTRGNKRRVISSEDSDVEYSEIPANISDKKNEGGNPCENCAHYENKIKTLEVRLRKFQHLVGKTAKGKMMHTQILR